MEFHLLDPAGEADDLRTFLRLDDPQDYLLDGLSDWIQEGRHWVGAEQGEWIAFGRLHDLGRGEGWVSGARVLARYRRQGIGARLLSRILEDAHSIGLAILRAIVEEGNLPSRRLLERFGFQPVAELTLRRGLADGRDPLGLRRLGPDQPIAGPVGWLPAMSDRVDLLPGSDGGRFGRWQPELLHRWAHEGKLFSGGGVTVAIQVDWWQKPRTMWVNPLRGEPLSLLRALGPLAKALDQAEWQTFFPVTEEVLAACETFGRLLPSVWGERARLYERTAPQRS